jgi:hypothetical protein
VSLSLWVAGCVQPIAYHPDTTVLQRLSRAEAAERIRYVLLRAINPQIDDVTVTEEFLSYRVHPTTTIMRLFFGKVGGVEVFDNHAAFVRADGGPFIAQLFFATAEEAKIFADLLMSFREVYRAQRAEREGK